jgi:SAM-dependent methyltransferase
VAGIMKMRWTRAQAEEKGFWEKGLADNPFYPEYLEFFRKNNILTEDRRICEIGSGPFGFVSSINNSDLKVALDPLMDFFQTKVDPEYYKERGIIPVTGKGEDLEFANDYFDIVCCINTLDHCEDPVKVLEESNRCLKKDGHLFITLNCYSKPIALLRKTLEWIGIGDVCHPHSYHLSGVKKMLYLHGFKLIDMEIGTIGDVRGKPVSPFKKAGMLLKSKGAWYVFTRTLAFPLQFIFKKLFKSYPNSLFLYEKEYNLEKR